MKSNLFKLLGPVRGVLVGSVLSALSITLTVQNAGAAYSCASVLSNEIREALSRELVPAADLNTQIAENYESWNVTALKEIASLARRVPSLSESAGGKRLLEGLNEVLLDERLSSFHELIQKAASNAQRDARAKKSLENGRDLFLTHLEAEVTNLMGKDVAKSRIAELKGRGKITKEEMMHALGDMTVAEARINLVGEKGINEVSPDSVIGRYLSKAAELGHPVKTLVGKFLTSPRSTARGSERLFVSVDRKTAPLIEALIGKNPHFLVHNHTPGQGTLHLTHNGQDISYAKYDGAGEIAGGTRYMEVDTMAPIIPLSSVEASNAMNYFELGRLTRSARTKYPSSLVDMTSGTPQLYMRPGAYTCCSHWFGEMAIGEKLVSKYSVPGQSDSYGRNQDPLAVDQTKTRTAPVGSFTHFSQHGDNIEIGTQSRTDRLTRMVWQSGKGSEQMWGMLGAKTQLSKAELTNPGYILYTLVATGDAARVPVVLIYRENATKPLTQAVLDQLRNDNNIPNY